MCKVPHPVNLTESDKGLFPDALYYGLGTTSVFSVVLGIQDYLTRGMENFWLTQAAIWIGGSCVLAVLWFFDRIVQRIPE